MPAGIGRYALGLRVNAVRPRQRRRETSPSPSPSTPHVHVHRPGLQGQALAWLPKSPRVEGRLLRQRYVLGWRSVSLSKSVPAVIIRHTRTILLAQLRVAVGDGLISSDTVTRLRAVCGKATHARARLGSAANAAASSGDKVNVADDLLQTTALNRNRPSATSAMRRRERAPTDQAVVRRAEAGASGDLARAG
jgi:hypothetical protein